VCSTTSPTSCACWTYAGSGSGRVINSGVAGQCGCPGGSDPTWD
jgi:hypothetical protein